MENEIVQFLRQKDYLYVKDIGRGGCAKTVFLKDEYIDEYFVCKKYSPANELNTESLFEKFVQEIKLLHLVSHKNIVRFFNHYLYPTVKVGYILMEYIIGDNIQEHLKKHPENINDIFIQTIEGFTYLEHIQILHRDIRPFNILITDAGIVKIIDFGFGKKINFGDDYEKSITLNWWCDVLPREFNDEIYDYKTEIYFVGKLFEKIILENDVTNFKYKDILNNMIKHNENERTDSFNSIHRSILTNRIDELNFTYDEKDTYRRFADRFTQLFTKFENDAKYKTDAEQIIKKLESIYKTSMLEEYLHNNVELTRCFVDGGYTYRTNLTIEIYVLENFISLIKSCSRDKQNIILNNLWNRLDTVPRYTKPDEDDLPF